MNLKFFVTAAILISTTTFAEDWKPVPIPQVMMKCFHETMPVEWSFCVNSVLGSTNNDLIYHFHGRNGAADWWNDQTYYTGKVHAHWLEKGIAPPTVVTISFGKLWLLTERKDENFGGLYRVFINEVMTRVEKEISHPIARRALVGESMGGVNALMVAFKSENRFWKAAALCPPVQNISPFASLPSIYRYISQSSTSWKRALMMLYFSRKFYPNEETWENNDPLELSKTYKQPKDVALYLTCGEKDDWGCMEGSKALVKNIQGHHGTLEWVPRPGGHCDIDIGSLADFLVK